MRTEARCTVSRYNDHGRKKFYSKLLRISSSDLIKFAILFSPRKPNCRRWYSVTGPSSSEISLSPCSVMCAWMRRRSFASRTREIRPRASRRSRSLVMSESMVIILSLISVQEAPSAPAPRRILRALYCVGVKSACFSNLPIFCEIRSDVRTMLKLSSSSGLGKGFVCFSSFCNFVTTG
jgi:hypothetical protein